MNNSARSERLAVVIDCNQNGLTKLQEEEKTNPDLISQRLQKEFDEKLASMPEWQAALVRKKHDGGP